MVRFFNVSGAEIKVKEIDRLEDSCKYVFIPANCVPFTTTYESFDTPGWYVFDTEWGGTWRHSSDVVYLANLYTEMAGNLLNLTTLNRA